MHPAVVASMLADGRDGGYSPRMVAEQLAAWELYLDVLSVIVGPFVTTIQRCTMVESDGLDHHPLADRAAVSRIGEHCPEQ